MRRVHRLPVGPRRRLKARGRNRTRRRPLKKPLLGLTLDQFDLLGVPVATRQLLDLVPAGPPILRISASWEDG